MQSQAYAQYLCESRNSCLCLSLKLRLINECLHVALLIFRQKSIFQPQKGLKPNFSTLIWLSSGGKAKHLNSWEDRWGYVYMDSFCPSKTSSTIFKCAEVCLSFTIWALQPANAIWFIFNLGPVFLWFWFTFLITFINMKFCLRNKIEQKSEKNPNVVLLAWGKKCFYRIESFPPFPVYSVSG